MNKFKAELNEYKEIIKEHFKHACKKKVSIMPFTAPIYLVWWAYKWVCIYLDDFIEFFKLKTTEEREEFNEKKELEFEFIEETKIYAFYALLATVIYFNVIGFDLRDGSFIQVINVPTYFYMQFILGMIDYFSNVPGIPLDQLHMLGHMNIN